MVVPSFRRNLSELIIVALIYRFLRRMQLVYVARYAIGWAYIVLDLHPAEVVYVACNQARGRATRRASDRGAE
jgi:hypothetical protein